MPKIVNQVTELGRQIKDIAKAHDLTQEEMAFKLRIGQQQLTKIVRGRSNPSIKLLKDIAAKFDKRLVILFMDKD